MSDNNKDSDTDDGSETSKFGVSERRNHNSTQFYNSDLYEDLNIPSRDDVEYTERSIDSEYINSVVNSDSSDMSEIPNESVHLAVTSPPYNAEKEYDEDWNLSEYRSMLNGVFTEVYDKLVWGGRLAVNLANLGRKPYIPLHAYIISDLIDIGFLMRGEIIWDKGASAGGSVAWGSWKSASNPVLRDVHEYILVFSKGLFGRIRNDNSVDTITKDQFLECTKSVWDMQTTSATDIGHPAPFPVELPRRLIELYSFKDDIVLDPFLGSGTTAIAAENTGRQYIGYEISTEFTKLARERIAENN